MPRAKKQPAAAAAEPPPPQPPQPDTKPPRRIAPHIAQFAVPIRSITPAARNARKHGAQNIDAIKASLQRFGQQRPVIIDAEGAIIAGNGTHAAALALGWDTIAAATSDLAGDDVTAFAIADNRTTELSEWDDEILRAQLADLAAADYELSATGFGDDDLLALQRAAANPVTAGSLQERFGVPPFSVLDTRQGYWQDRKRAWLALGIKSELGRGEDMAYNTGDSGKLRREYATPGGAAMPAMNYSKTKARGDGRGRPMRKRVAGDKSGDASSN